MERTPQTPLIVPGSSETLLDTFDRGLRARDVTWLPAVRAVPCKTSPRSSPGAAASAGHRRSVAHPGAKRAGLPLTDFDPIEIVVTWSVPTEPVVSLFVDVLRERARNTWTKSETDADDERRNRNF